MGFKNVLLVSGSFFLLICCGKNDITTIQNMEGRYCGRYTELIATYPRNDTHSIDGLAMPTLSESHEVHSAFTFSHGPLADIPIIVNGNKLKLEYEITRTQSSQIDPRPYKVNYRYTGQGEIFDDNQIEITYTIRTNWLDINRRIETEGTMNLLPPIPALYTGKFEGARTQLEIVSQNDSLLSSGSFVTLNQDTIYWRSLYSYFPNSCNLISPFTDSVSQQLQRHLNVTRTGETFLLLFNDLANGTQSDTLHRVN